MKKRREHREDRSGSPIAFTARPLNSRRRQDRTAAPSTDDRRHLDEIGQMPRLAAEMVPVPPEKRRAALRWADAVAAASGLVDAPAT